MFGEIVSEVVAAAAPVNIEVALLDAVLDPVEAHVDCLGATLLHGLVGDSGCTRVVSLHRSGALWVTHVDECGTKGGSIFAVEEKGAEFGFSGAG